MNGIHLTHNVFAFIQARSGSTRLPNKVLRPFIGEQTILDLIMDRVKKVLPEDRIYLLIPEQDSLLKEFASHRNYSYFSGSELDVRDRFLKAAEKYQAEWILRLTGDNPFLDITHLELLLESIRFTDADVLSFSHLPIGTTGEIFRTKAIAREPQSGLEERHREHVSLHLKEFPIEYKFLKLEPFLSSEEREISQNIRVTIDEEKDWETCKEIWENLRTDYFGTQELHWLYKIKPELFEKNRQVEQVSFSLPESAKKDKGKVGITYAPLMEHGSGHFTRMRILSVYLQSLGYEVDIRDKFTGVELDLEILDYRDTELPPSYSPDKWVKLDNLGLKQGKESFFYSLPHPKLQLSDYKENLLVTHSVELNRSMPRSVKTGICIYAGGLDEKSSQYLDTWVKEKYPDEEIIRVGGVPPILNNINYEYRLTIHGFSSAIVNSRIFITYFGQSLLEGIYLGAECYSYSISSYHEELSLLAQTVLGVTYLGNVFLQNLNYNAIDSDSRYSELKGEGFLNLISLIKEKMEKKNVK